jgi:hypothetical protein
MPQGDVEVFYNNGDGHWRVQLEGGEILDGDYETKPEAVAAGRQEARDREVELVIKNQGGTISEKQSHGNDIPEVPG